MQKNNRTLQQLSIEAREKGPKSVNNKHTIQKKNTTQCEKYYHPSKTKKKRPVGAVGRCSSSATIPATTPDTIDATDVHGDTTIALPCFRPRVCTNEMSHQWKIKWYKDRIIQKLLDKSSRQMLKTHIFHQMGPTYKCNRKQQNKQENVCSQENN